MKIAIVKLSALGDIVHAMIVLQLIKNAMPEAQIDWIVEEIFAPVLEHNPHIDNILTVHLKALKKEKTKLFAEIQKLKRYKENQYDLIIDLQGLIKSAFVSKILGKSVGFDKDSIREKWAALLYHTSFFVPYGQNVIERNIVLIQAACKIEPKEKFIQHKEPFLYYLPHDEEKTAPYLKSEHPTIVYILGSSWESKMYPKEKFVEIINLLEGNHLLVWGNDRELDAAQYIALRTEAKVMPKMNLNELKALIAHADLVIGGDSGPTHFAWAMNRPSITIFGPTPSQRNTWQTNINKVVDCGNTIDPLRLNKKDDCIQTIEIKNIIGFAKDILNKS